MTRVLRIINRFNLGGPTYNATYLTRDLPAPYETLLVGGTHMESEESSMHILRQAGVEAMILPEMQRAINPRGDLDALLKLKKIIKSYRPDIVHTHASKAGFLGRLAAITENVPIIVHTFHGHVFHSYFPPWKTALYKQLERFLAKRSTAIIAISPLQKKELSEIHRICRPEKIHVIPLGFELERFRDPSGTKRQAFREKYGLNDEIAIGILGRLVPIKNHQMFLQAFAELKKRGTVPLRGFIMGGGEEATDLRIKAEALGLTWQDDMAGSADITFTSWIRDVDQALPGLDILALTSRNEGTPVSLIEAQAAGLPIVSTEVGGVADVVSPGKTGILTPSGEPLLFAGALEKLAQDSLLRKEMGLQGWEHVADKFSVNRLVSDTRELYERLLQS